MKRQEAVEIGLKLKRLRIDSGLTQSVMGELVEITDAAWRQYELGVRIPKDAIKRRISKHFGISIDDLFF